MPMITYTRDIPDAPNNPSVDQGPMKTNTNSIDTIIAVDHYTFADSTAGNHKLVTYAANNTPPAQTGLAAAEYTAPGTADASTSQLFYKTSTGDFQLSAIRAWGLFAGATGAVNGSQSKNVASISRTSAGTYRVTLTANAVAAGNNNFAVFITSASNNVFAPIGTYTIISPGVFDILTRSGGTLGGGPIDPLSVSFMVLQI